MNNKFYTKVYSNKISNSSSNQVRINFILKNIPDNNLEILDIGCWDGTFTQKFKKKTNKAFGIDILKGTTKEAKKNQVIVKEGDFLEKDYFNNIKFDIIVAGEIIEHVFDTDLFLEKIYKKLKKNGKLIITTPNSASLPRRILLLFGKNPLLEYSSKKKHGAVGHIRYFTFDSLHTLLEENKFSIIVSSSDILNFNNKGTFYSIFLAKLYKRFGKSIMIVARKT